MSLVAFEEQRLIVNYLNEECSDQYFRVAKDSEAKNQ